jgi:hypothetical protein
VWEEGLPAEKKPNEPIKVTDKRIFDSAGEIRKEYRDTVTPTDPAQASSPTPSTGAAESSPKAAAEPAAPTPATDRHFLVLLQLLFDVAMQQFEYARRGTPEAKEGARQFIGMLEALEKKVAGNLSPEEAEGLKQVLGELKLGYVQITKGIKI